MLALDPPTENSTATRAALIRYLRERLSPLFPDADELDALPAWLWSLNAATIARTIGLGPEDLAHSLAASLDRETDRRHPAEAFASLIAEKHPHLSSVIRSRLADFAETLRSVRASKGAASYDDMMREGFTRAECERLSNRALDLIEVARERKALAEEPSGAALDPAAILRNAGTRAHTNRAFADGELELDAAACARVTMSGLVAAVAR